jgi:hypothetical protein
MQSSRRRRLDALLRVCAVPMYRHLTQYGLVAERETFITWTNQVGVDLRNLVSPLLLTNGPASATTPPAMDVAPVTVTPPVSPGATDVWAELNHSRSRLIHSQRNFVTTSQRLLDTIEERNLLKQDLVLEQDARRALQIVSDTARAALEKTREQLKEKTHAHRSLAVRHNDLGKRYAERQATIQPETTAGALALVLCAQSPDTKPKKPTTKTLQDQLNAALQVLRDTMAERDGIRDEFYAFQTAVVNLALPFGFTSSSPETDSNPSSTTASPITDRTTASGQQADDAAVTQEIQRRALHNQARIALRSIDEHITSQASQLHAAAERLASAESITDEAFLRHQELSGEQDNLVAELASIQNQVLPGMISERDAAIVELGEVRGAFLKVQEELQAKTAQAQSRLDAHLSLLKQQDASQATIHGLRVRVCALEAERDGISTRLAAACREQDWATARLGEIQAELQLKIAEAQDATDARQQAEERLNLAIGEYDDRIEAIVQERAAAITAAEAAATSSVGQREEVDATLREARDDLARQTVLTGEILESRELAARRLESAESTIQAMIEQRRALVEDLDAATQRSQELEMEAKFAARYTSERLHDAMQDRDDARKIAKAAVQERKEIQDSFNAMKTAYENAQAEIAELSVQSTENPNH